MAGTTISMQLIARAIVALPRSVVPTGGGPASTGPTSAHWPLTPASRTPGLNARRRHDAPRTTSR